MLFEQISCVILDNDERVAQSLISIGNEFKKISFHKAVENQEAALNMISKINPEIIFINLESPNINFIEFLFELQKNINIKPHFIALSNSKSYAYKAYQYDFADFLLKPLSENSIRNSILKYIKRNPIKKSETICLKSNKDYRYIKINSILYLKADNNTTDFYMSDGTIIEAYKTLKVFENSLTTDFFRIHRSYIINKNHISRIHYGKWICIVGKNHKIPFTKTYLENINLIKSDIMKKRFICLN